ncbi:family 43 glycosylhydrolase [Streptomyces sp. NPDC097640]|uniref:family 43 glycosylhydrolase n=1 Tax=Streptomyces sp. NPDC097640 TaxID=3157229 RepID=UPI003317384C
MRTTSCPPSLPAPRTAAVAASVLTALALILMTLVGSAGSAAASGSGAGSGSGSGSGVADRSAPVRYTTLYNFAPRDLLRGDDGLSPSSAAPLRYGTPTLNVDDQNNGIEEHEATISYFDGRYYKYGSKWACGKLVYFSGTIPGQTRPQPYPSGDYGGQCGIGTYSSTDLTNWRLENISTPTVDGQAVDVAKPNVVWSPGLGKYLMWVKVGSDRASNLQSTGGLYYAVADTPAGPWGELTRATGDHLAHDFDIVTAADGTAWIVTDTFSGSYDPDVASLPLWDVWVQKLNADRTGTTSDAVRVMSKAHFEGIGFAQHDGHWYITGGPTCANCAVPIQYVSASDPLGPWSNEAGDTGDALHAGTELTSDGCGGQNKGLNMLPSAAGPIVLSGIFGYRTGPNSYVQDGKVVHGDNSQAIASTYWYPLQFDDSGHLKPFTCQKTVRVPLADTVRHQGTASDYYQPDCRIRTDSAIQQTGVRLRDGQSRLSLPVFQRTDDLGPFAQDGPVLNASLNITVKDAHGDSTTATIKPSAVSWAPERVDVPLPKKLRGQKLTVTLTTTASNGCYGVLVHPATVTAPAAYSVLRAGVPKASPGAGLLIGDGSNP